MRENQSIFKSFCPLCVINKVQLTKKEPNGILVATLNRNNNEQTLTSGREIGEPVNAADKTFLQPKCALN